MSDVIFWITKVIFWLALWLLYPIKVHGRENLPARGAFIICPNHISMLDPVMLLIYTRRRIWFMAKRELFEIPVVRFIVSNCGGFPVERGRADMAAMREALAVIKRGDPLGIFPQGTREREGEDNQMHSGAALIAQRTGAPVIPVYIKGPYRTFRRTHIYIGAPVDLSQYAKKYDSDTVAQVTRDIERAIYAIIA